MSNAIATRNTTAVAVPLDRSRLVEVLQSSLYPGAQPASIALVLDYCAAAGYDPLQKPCHIVPMWDSKSGGMRDVIMPGIGLYRTQAARTGCLVGITEPEFGPEIIEKIGGQDMRYPEWCRVTVKRLVSGIVAEFTAVEFWMENYAVKGGKERSVAPNAMWTKRPRGQIAKCAQAQALRMAFPEATGSAPSAEEMEGKRIDDAEIIEHERQPPARVAAVRSALRPAPAEVVREVLDPPTLAAVLAMIEAAQTAEDLAATREYVDALADDDERKQALTAGKAQAKRIKSAADAEAEAERTAIQGEPSDQT
jgi:phage recombination protein Bet